MENQETNYCTYCATGYQLEDAFCNSCGYPLQGTKEEQDAYTANRTTKEIDLIELNKKVERACNSLYWVAGIIGVSSLLQYSFRSEDEDPTAFFITLIVLVGAFLALAVWSKTKPATAIISGLALFVILQLLNAVVDPKTLLSGILFKIFIIGYLVKGIMAVLEVEKIKKELNIK